ncbi:hypothetical protein D3C75_1008240 [compost metagenome]
MGPAQFVTQCVTNWERLVEQAHIPKVGGVEALAEFRCKYLGQGRKQLFSIPRPPGSFLLEFDNMPTDLPAALHLNGINRAQHLLSCLADQLTKIAKQ